MSERARVTIAMAIILLLVALAAWRAHAATVFPSRYDSQIQAAVTKFWPDYPDYKFWKAQLYQESKLDPTAISPVGAEGLAQFMPGTWRDIERALYAGATVSRTLAGPAIDGGAYYMAGLRRTWRGARPLDDRHRIGEASYNAGTGNILKAQKLCRDAALWADIAPCLPRVTGSDFAHQTTDYVTRIAAWRGMMP